MFKYFFWLPLCFFLDGIVPSLLHDHPKELQLSCGLVKLDAEKAGVGNVFGQRFWGMLHKVEHLDHLCWVMMMMMMMMMMMTTWLFIWVLPKIGVPPKSSILIAVFHYFQPSILGETPLIFRNIHMGKPGDDACLYITGKLKTSLFDEKCVFCHQAVDKEVLIDGTLFGAKWCLNVR